MNPALHDDDCGAPQPTRSRLSTKGSARVLALVKQLESLPIGGGLSISTRSHFQKRPMQRASDKGKTLHQCMRLNLPILCAAPPSRPRKLMFLVSLESLLGGNLLCCRCVRSGEARDHSSGSHQADNTGDESPLSKYISRFVHVSFGYHCFPPKLPFFRKRRGRNANCKKPNERCTTCTFVLFAICTDLHEISRG